MPECFLRMTVNERGSEKNKAERRNVINLPRAQYFGTKKKTGINVTGNKELLYKTWPVHDLFGIIKND